MLIKLIYHAFNLDAGWFMYDLLWVFIVMTFMCYAFYVLTEGKHSIKGFIFMMIFLYAVLDVVALTGLHMFVEENMLVFTLFQMCCIVLLARTRFEKHKLAIFVAFFFVASWLVTF